MDPDIQALRNKIQRLRLKRAALSTRALSSYSTPLHATATASTSDSVLEDTSPFISSALEKTSAQQRHELENLYRLGAGVTLFAVQDPDPTAVDKGAITGVRLEVFVGGRFLQPYYVLLNRLPSDPERFRIHRHTIPPSIPLPSLAARYMALPKSTPAEGSEKRPNIPPQDLPQLVRELRRELVAYHQRLAKLQTVKSRLLRPRKGRDAFQKVDVNVEARELRFETEDGLLSRIRVDKEGKIEQCVAITGAGREKDLEHAITSHGTLDGLGDVLRELV